MNHITIELCEEDRQRIDNLFAAVATAAAELDAIIRNMPDAVTGLPAAPAAPAEEDKPEPKQEEPAPEAEPAVTLADIRALVQRLVAPGGGKKPAATAIVKSYAPNVGGIPADKYAEVWQKLTDLEKEE